MHPFDNNTTSCPLWFINRQVGFSVHPFLGFLSSHLIPAKLAKKRAPQASQDGPSLQHQSLRFYAMSNKEAQPMRLSKKSWSRRNRTHFDDRVPWCYGYDVQQKQSREEILVMSAAVVCVWAWNRFEWNWPQELACNCSPPTPYPLSLYFWL
jgi:hypothetical protein